MSLINDALKKAQKQRTGEAPPLAAMPGVGGESPQRIAKRAQPAGFGTLMVRAGLGGAVVLVLAVGGFLLLREKPEDRGQKTDVSSVQAPNSPLPAPSSSPSSVVRPPSSDQNPSSGVSPPSSETPAPTFTLPTAPKSEDRGRTTEVSSVNVGGALRPDVPPSPVAKRPDEPRRGSESVGGQAPATTQSPQPSAPAAPPPKLEPRAIQFIESIKVAGIRASTTDAKVLMNDRVYRLGSTVEAELGLTLVEITANSLTFEDDRGGRYTRTF